MTVIRAAKRFPALPLAAEHILKLKFRYRIFEADELGAVLRRSLQGLKDVESAAAAFDFDFKLGICSSRAELGCRASRNLMAEV